MKTDNKWILRLMAVLMLATVAVLAHAQRKITL